MPRITWDQIGQKIYETGVDRGVLYPDLKEDGSFGGGVAWNGLINVTEQPSGAEASPLYADNIKYLNLVSAEDYGSSIEAYTCPPEFYPCDGTAEVMPGVYVGQQNRKTFGMSYRTLIGNDVENTDHGYKLHLVYNGLAAPSERAYATVNDSPEAITFSWEVTTTPVSVEGFKPTACVTIDSTKVDSAKLKALEDILYGGENAEARLPLPAEVFALMDTAVKASAQTNA